jgi:DNA-binding FadR family transcriptional regulator
VDPTSPERLITTTGTAAPRRPAYAQVADDLRRQIVSGALAAGDRLPSEDALADRYQVSRSTVREALRVLTSQNLVVTTRGVTGGTFIAVPDPAQVADLLEMSVGLLAVAEQIDVDQLLFVRESLEVPAVRLAAQRAADGADDLGLGPWLGESVPDDDQRDGDDARARFAFNRSFHHQVLAAAGNPLLEILTRPVFTVLEQRYLRDRAPGTFWDRVHHDHEGIARSVVAGDVDTAVSAMRAHLHDLRDTYVALETDSAEEPS